MWLQVVKSSGISGLCSYDLNDRTTSCCSADNILGEGLDRGNSSQECVIALPWLPTADKPLPSIDYRDSYTYFDL